MIVVGLWIIAALALVLAILVIRRAQLATDGEMEEKGLGRWLLPFMMTGFMSLRLASALHRGIAVAFPMMIAVVSIVILITFGDTLRPD